MDCPDARLPRPMKWPAGVPQTPNDSARKSGFVASEMRGRRRYEGSSLPSPSHHLVTTLNRERPDLTAYNRCQRTARFPVNTRESEGFRRHSATTKLGPEPSKGSQVLILSARQECLGNARLSETFRSTGCERVVATSSLSPSWRCRPPDPGPFARRPDFRRRHHSQRRSASWKCANPFTACRAVER